MAVITPRGSKPGRTSSTRARLRRNRPAPTRSMSARAVSPTTRVERSRCLPRPDMPERPLPWSTSPARTAPICQAGNKPNSSAEARAAPTVNRRTGRSMRAPIPMAASSGASREQRADAGVSQGQARDRAGKGQQQAFRGGLADQPPAAGAERGTHGDFTRASGGPSQHEAGDIGADDQEDEADGAQEDEQGTLGVAGHEIGHGDGERAQPRPWRRRRRACRNFSGGWPAPECRRWRGRRRRRGGGGRRRYSSH